MKMYRSALRWTVVILIISFVFFVSFGIASYFDFHCPMIYDISIGIFCSAVLVFATSLIGYFYENQRLLFDFFEQFIVVHNKINMYLLNADALNNKLVNNFLYDIFDIERQKLIKMYKDYAPIGKHKKNMNILWNVIDPMKQIKKELLKETINPQNLNDVLNEFIDKYMKPNTEKLMKIINNNGKINKESNDEI